MLFTIWCGLAIVACFRSSLQNRMSDPFIHHSSALSISNEPGRKVFSKVTNRKLNKCEAPPEQHALVLAALHSLCVCQWKVEDLLVIVHVPASFKRPQTQEEPLHLWSESSSQLCWGVCRLSLVPTNQIWLGVWMHDLPGLSVFLSSRPHPRMSALLLRDSISDPFHLVWRPLSSLNPPLNPTHLICYWLLFFDPPDWSRMI